MNLYAKGAILAFLALVLLLALAYGNTVRLMLFAAQVAYEKKLNIDHFFKVINCESGWDPRIQSGYQLPDGTYERSWGIAQFNLDTNQITLDEALDPEFSLRKMAEFWAEGKMSAWKCYQLWEARNWR